MCLAGNGFFEPLVKLLQWVGVGRALIQRNIDLFLVLDWMMQLPSDLKQQLWQNLRTMEQENRMAYVSSVEEIGIEKGVQKGIEQGREQGQNS